MPIRNLSTIKRRRPIYEDQSCLPANARWCGPVPDCVQRVVQLSKTDMPDRYVEWSNHFAVLKPRFIACITKDAPVETIEQLRARGWRGPSIIQETNRWLGRDLISIMEWSCGFIIECHRPPEQPRTDILSITDWPLPVICPTLLSAVQVAEACYPNASAPLCWRENK